jgi:hypothetical protein
VCVCCKKNLLVVCLKPRALCGCNNSPQFVRILPVCPVIPPVYLAVPPVVRQFDQLLDSSIRFVRSSTSLFGDSTSWSGNSTCWSTNTRQIARNVAARATHARPQTSLECGRGRQVAFETRPRARNSRVHRPRRRGKIHEQGMRSASKHGGSCERISFSDGRRSCNRLRGVCCHMYNSCVIFRVWPDLDSAIADGCTAPQRRKRVGA